MGETRTNALQSRYVDLFGLRRRTLLQRLGNSIMTARTDPDEVLACLDSLRGEVVLEDRIRTIILLLAC